MTNENIVLFLGAGFSCDAGLPMMNNFASESDQEYIGISHQGNAAKDATPILLRAGEIFKKFQKYVLPISGLMNMDANNMEDVFCLADMIQGASVDKNIIIPEVDNLGIDEIISNIRLWLWKIFQQCPPINNSSDRKKEAWKNKQAYEDFFRFLVEKHKKDQNISILTTNYDLMPEFFINEVCGECTYNICSGYNEWKVLPCSKNKFVHINRDGLIPIHKLHGSVNYFFDDKANKDNINLVTDKLNPDMDAVGKSRASVFKNRPSLFPLEAIVELKKLNNGKIPIPAIIPPMYSKMESMQWLKSIWANASVVIKNAKTIVFIGYSFPQSDSFMKSFFQAAFLNRKNKQMPRIIDLDMDKNVINSYQRIFKNISNADFLTGTFIQKCGDLIKMLS